MPVYRQSTGTSHNTGHKSASTPLYCRYCQDELEWTIQHVLNEIKDGYPSGGYVSPPIPLI